MAYKIKSKDHFGFVGAIKVPKDKKKINKVYAILSKKSSSVEYMPISQVKTKEQARTMAMDYQNYASEQDMSYGELIEHQNYFEKLGKKFGLLKEFKENGIV